MSKELLESGESTWKKVLNFIIEVLKLIVAAFLGGTTANFF